MPATTPLHDRPTIGDPEHGGRQPTTAIKVAVAAVALIMATVVVAGVTNSAWPVVAATTLLLLALLGIGQLVGRLLRDSGDDSFLS